MKYLIGQLRQVYSESCIKEFIHRAVPFKTPSMSTTLESELLSFAKAQRTQNGLAGTNTFFLVKAV